MQPAEMYDSSKEFLNASTADLRSIALEAVERAGDIARNLGGEALSRAEAACSAADGLLRATRELTDYLCENGMADPE